MAHLEVEDALGNASNLDLSRKGAPAGYVKDAFRVTLGNIRSKPG